jgi:hypothetical protein
MAVVALGFINSSNCSVCLAIYEYEDAIRGDMGAAKDSAS